MAIVRETVNSGGTGAANTSTVVTAPSGVAANDFLVLGIAFNGSPSTVTPDTGWTQIGPSASPPTNPRLCIFTKKAGGSEPGTYTFGHTGSVYDSWIIARYSGVDQTTPEDATAVGTTSAGTPGTAVSLTGITTVTNDAMLLAFLVSNSSAQRITEGNVLTEVVETFGTSIKNQELDDGVQAVAGASGSLAFTLNTSLDWAGYVLALRPAAVAGGGIAAILLGGL